MKGFYSPTARIVGAVLPWAVLVAAVWFGWNALDRLRELDLFWFGVSAAACAWDVWAFIGLRRNHRELKVLDARLVALRERLAELKDPEW